jgi:hypothetical protein
LLTCAPIANPRKQRGLATRAQDNILPHNQTDPLPNGWALGASVCAGHYELARSDDAVNRYATRYATRLRFAKRPITGRWKPMPEWDLPVVLLLMWGVVIVIYAVLFFPNLVAWIRHHHSTHAAGHPAHR